MNFAVYDCYNDAMNHVDCFIKRDVYPQKMTCSKNIRDISFFVLKISMVDLLQENIYHRCYCIGISFVERQKKNISSIDKHVNLDSMQMPTLQIDNFMFCI